MLQGIYTGTQGMVPLMYKQEHIANNLVNMNTTGYKQSSLFVKSFENHLQNSDDELFVNEHQIMNQTYTDFSEGAMRKTGNNFDMMIHGSGFFSVMTPDGVRYTRNGNFSVNQSGYLVNSEGNYVLGKNGFIRLSSSSDVTVDNKGTISQDGMTKGELQIADFKKPYRMARDGNSLFRPLLPNNPPLESTGFVVKQGFLEGSNASPIRSMIDMIAAQKQFEFNQKAVQAQDQTLEKAINEVGKLQ